MIKARWILPALITVFGLGVKAAKAPLNESEPIFIGALIFFFIAAFMCIIDDNMNKTSKEGGTTDGS